MGLAVSDTWGVNFCSEGTIEILVVGGHYTELLLRFSRS